MNGTNKKSALFAVVLIVLTVFTLYASGVNETGGYGRGNGGGSGNGIAVDEGFTAGIETALASVEKEALSDAETQGILLMREEEKLARDVYTALYEKWDVRTFANISKAEQTHMDAMKLLVDRYELIDPMTNDNLGVFTSPELQKLYDNLVAQGSISLESALETGSTIEDLDIYDLDRLIKTTDNKDVKIVYQNLLKGSRNHLRAFDRQLQRNGFSYTAQYLSQREYNSIASSQQERGTVITDPDFKY